MFIVEKDGALIDIHVSKDDSYPLTAFESEVVSVVKKMPKWIPGRCGNKIVPVLHKCQFMAHGRADEHHAQTRLEKAEKKHST